MQPTRQLGHAAPLALVEGWQVSLWLESLLHLWKWCRVSSSQTAVRTREESWGSAPATATEPAGACSSFAAPENLWLDKERSQTVFLGRMFRNSGKDESSCQLRLCPCVPGLRIQVTSMGFWSTSLTTGASTGVVLRHPGCQCWDSCCWRKRCRGRESPTPKISGGSEITQWLQVRWSSENWGLLCWIQEGALSERQSALMLFVGQQRRVASSTDGQKIL